MHMGIIHQFWPSKNLGGVKLHFFFGVPHYFFCPEYCHIVLWDFETVFLGHQYLLFYFQILLVFWCFWSMHNSYVIHRKCLKIMRRVSFFYLLGRKFILMYHCIHRLCVVIKECISCNYVHYGLCSCFIKRMRRGSFFFVNEYVS